MKTITLEEYKTTLKAQGITKSVDAVFVCPMCGTLQSAHDLIAAGAGADLDAVEKYLAFSCIGRFTHGMPPPEKKEMGSQVGCNWTLGGLLGLHVLEVVTPDGKKHPRFEPATPEAALAYCNDRKTRKEIP